jgi:hypothetical protein
MNGKKGSSFQSGLGTGNSGMEKVSKSIAERGSTVP